MVESCLLFIVHMLVTNSLNLLDLKMAYVTLAPKRCTSFRFSSSSSRILFVLFNHCVNLSPRSIGENNWIWNALYSTVLTWMFRSFFFVFFFQGKDIFKWKWNHIHHKIKTPMEVDWFDRMNKHLDSEFWIQLNGFVLCYYVCRTQKKKKEEKCKHFDRHFNKLEWKWCWPFVFCAKPSFPDSQLIRCRKSTCGTNNHEEKLLSSLRFNWWSL